MSHDVSPAASSAAPEPIEAVSVAEQAIASNDVAAFREARRAERAGKPLSTPAAASSAAPPEDPAQTPAADSSPADPETKRPDKRATENRIPDLLNERRQLREEKARLERELSALRSTGTPPPDASPAAPSPATAKAIEYPAELSSYDAYAAHKPEASYEDYLEARADVRAEQRQAAQAAHAQAKQTQTEYATRVRQRDTQFRERLNAATQADPAFMDAMSEDVKRLKPFDAIRDASGRFTEQPTGYHAVAEGILESDIAPTLMRHFSDHPDDLHRIAKLAPAPLLKEMGKLEATLASGKPASGGTPPKLVTDSPEPPTQLGRRPAEPDNPVDAAVAAGDVAAFRAAKLRQRAAQMSAR
jgi:hypothetical protein